MKKLSKKILALLAISTVFTSIASTSYADSFPFLTINGKRVSTTPVIRNGRTLVPIRVIGEELGSQVDYNSATREVTVVKPGINIKLKIDKNNPTVNGVTKSIDVPATIINSRTYVPVRFVSESFGINVDYNQQNNEVIVGKPATSPLPSINQTLTFEVWEDRMDLKFGDNWDDRLENSLKIKYGEYNLNIKYGNDWDDRLEYALYQHYQGKIPTSMPTDIPPTLTPVQPTTPVVPPTSNTGKLSFSQWEDRMELRFGDDWNDMIEDAIEYKYGEWHMEYYYGDDWDDRLEYALYLYYNGQIPNSLIKDIPNTLKPIR